jgi:hypothetical protein
MHGKSRLPRRRRRAAAAGLFVTPPPPTDKGRRAAAAAADILPSDAGVVFTGQLFFTLNIYCIWLL